MHPLLRRTPSLHTLLASITLDEVINLWSQLDTFRLDTMDPGTILAVVSLCGQLAGAAGRAVCGLNDLRERYGLPNLLGTA
jgi:hypothetical protein